MVSSSLLVWRGGYEICHWNSVLVEQWVGLVVMRFVIGTGFWRSCLHFSLAGFDEFISTSSIIFLKHREPISIISSHLLELLPGLLVLAGPIEQRIARIVDRQQGQKNYQSGVDGQMGGIFQLAFG